MAEVKNIIVIKGKPRSGKSTAVKALYKALEGYEQTKKYFEITAKDISEAHNIAGDIVETICLNDFDISLASHGDNYDVLKKILEDLDGKGWDILICCCHLYNKNRSTHRLIKERYKGANIKWENVLFYDDAKDKAKEERRIANLLLKEILIMSGETL